MSDIDTALYEARQALRNGYPADAWKLAAPIVKADPQNAAAWRMLADISEAKAPEKAREYRAKADAIETAQRFTPPPAAPPVNPMPIPAAATGATIALTPLHSLAPPTTPTTPAFVPPPAQIEMLLDGADQAFHAGRWAEVWDLVTKVQRADPANERARMLLTALPPPTQPLAPIGYAPNPMKAQIAMQLGQLEQQLAFHHGKLQHAQAYLASANSSRVGIIIGLLLSLVGFVCAAFLWPIWVIIILAAIAAMFTASSKQNTANKDIQHAHEEIARLQHQAAPLRAQLMGM